MTKVKDGSTVKVHYTGKLTDGSVFDSSEGREPLAFTVGAGMMIPGFEKGVMGMDGPPWAQADRYRENSAVLQANKVTTPLMLVHGDQDQMIPVAELSAD